MGQRWCLSIPLEDNRCPLISRRYIYIPLIVSWLGCALCQDLIQDVSWADRLGGLDFPEGHFSRTPIGLDFPEEHFKSIFGGLEMS